MCKNNYIKESRDQLIEDQMSLRDEIACLKVLAEEKNKLADTFREQKEKVVDKCCTLEIKYKILAEYLAKMLFGEDEFERKSLDSVELIELMIEDEYDRKKAYAKFCKVLHEIINKQNIPVLSFYDVDKLKLAECKNQIKENAWYNLASTKESSYGLSRYTIINSYLSWFQEQYEDEKAMQRLRYIFNKCGWEDNDLKELVLYVKQHPEKTYDKKKVEWLNIGTCIDNKKIKYSYHLH